MIQIEITGDDSDKGKELGLANFISRTLVGLQLKVAIITQTSRRHNDNELNLEIGYWREADQDVCIIIKC